MHIHTCMHACMHTYIALQYVTLHYITLHTYIHTYIHTHKLTHHHPSITLILPLPLLLFYAQSKSGEVVNMWGYPLSGPIFFAHISSATAFGWGLGSIRGLKALPSVTAPALAKPWHASAMLPSPQPNAVAEEICEKKKNSSQAEKFFPLGTW